MGFCQADAGRLCWIYPGGRLMPLPNVERTTLQHQPNFLYLSSDEEFAHPAPPIPPSSFARPSSSSQTPYPDHGDIAATLRSIQEEQASLRAYVAFEHPALHDVLQEQHDELPGMIPSQN